MKVIDINLIKSAITKLESNDFDGGNAYEVSEILRNAIDWRN